MRKHAKKQKHIKLPVDTRNRVCLTRFLSKEMHISSFRAYQEGSKIILEPLVEVPAEEHWLYRNPEAKTSLMRGLEDIKEGRVSKLDRDFSQFLDDEEI